MKRPLAGRLPEPPADVTVTEETAITAIPLAGKLRRMKCRTEIATSGGRVSLYKSQRGGKIAQGSYLFAWQKDEGGDRGKERGS